MDFVLQYTSGVQHSLHGYPEDTLAYILEQNQIINPGFTSRYFFLGKELIPETTLKGAGIKNGSKIICLLKKKQLVAPVIRRVKPLKPQQIRQRVMTQEGAKLIDRHYNAYEMNVKRDIVFKAAIEKQNALESAKSEEIITVTNIDYKPEISEDPLPFAFHLREIQEECFDAELEESFSVSNPISFHSGSSSNLD